MLIQPIIMTITVKVDKLSYSYKLYSTYTLYCLLHRQSVTVKKAVW